MYYVVAVATWKEKMAGSSVSVAHFQNNNIDFGFSKWSCAVEREIETFIAAFEIFCPLRKCGALNISF